MASLLLACAAMCSERIAKRRKARREEKKDYDDQFEALKAENLRRESWRQSYLAQTSDTTIPAHAPPSYEDIAVRKSTERMSGARGAQRQPMETVQERSGDVTPEQRTERTNVVRAQS
ncbi:hypothetical protein FKW77_006572 [Venturia effusa]|uniref:Uncharacterized protein n=1 Tax=Venturia effusa TaxID=50376 RepID=A0A517LQC8_9PEZI|nr:hypothetical protein FKW77_006572 [Venturia effusa]